MTKLTLALVLLSACSHDVCVAWKEEVQQRCAGYVVGKLVVTTCHPETVQVCTAYERPVK